MRCISGDLLDTESGISLIETTVALAILGTIVVTFLSGLVLTTEAAFTTDEQTTVESLARSQMEWVQEADYIEEATSYTAATLLDTDDYTGYSTDVTAEPLNNPDDGIQKITITVSRGGREIINLEGYKVD
ncbi:hypothetical protein ACFLWR_05175 [Chloroflexota bacterium]